MNNLQIKLEKIQGLIQDYEKQIELKIFSDKNKVIRFSESKIQKSQYIDKLEVEVTVLQDSKYATVYINSLELNEISKAIDTAEEKLKFMSKKYKSNLDVYKSIVYVNNEIEKIMENNFIENQIQTSIQSLSDGYFASGTVNINKKIEIVLNNKNLYILHGELSKLIFNTIVYDKYNNSGYVEFITDKIKEVNLKQQFNIALYKAIKSKKKIQLKTGKYTVILDPLALSDIINILSYYGFSAKSICDKKSFLYEKHNKKIFDERITIIDDIYNENVFGFPFDFEGEKKQKVEIIKGGIFFNAVYDKNSSIKDNIKNTGHSINDSDVGGYACNLIINNGDKSIKKIIRQSDNVVFISRVHYIDIINLKDGVFSASLENGSFYIKEGKISFGIDNLRITDSIFNLLNFLEEISEERCKVPNFLNVNYFPYIKVKNIQLYEI